MNIFGFTIMRTRTFREKAALVDAAVPYIAARLRHEKARGHWTKVVRCYCALMRARRGAA